jgi:hypothetical protein
MLILEIDAEIDPDVDTQPKLYDVEQKSFHMTWVAEGTDGELYLVPAEAGGWLRRSAYNGPREGLAPISPERARTIMWFVYGDIGPVTISGSRPSNHGAAILDFGFWILD